MNNLYGVDFLTKFGMISSFFYHFHILYIQIFCCKYFFEFFQFQKKLEQAEKEKNNAVIKYATREAEILRLRNDCEKLKGKVLYFYFYVYILYKKYIFINI